MPYKYSIQCKQYFIFIVSLKALKYYLKIHFHKHDLLMYNIHIVEVTRYLSHQYSSSPEPIIYKKCHVPPTTLFYCGILKLFKLKKVHFHGLIPFKNELNSTFK